MTTFYATVFFLINVHVLISFSFSTRQYATDLPTLITALRHTEAIITPLPISQQTTRRQLMKPILALPFDLEQFQKHLLHNWTTYYGEKQISTMTKPLNVTPDCNCYNYYRVKWKPDQWTILRRDPIMSFLDFEMINLKLIKQSFYLIPHIHAALPPYHMHSHNSFDALMFISQIISYFYEKYEFVRFKLFYHHIAWAHKYSGPCFLNIQDFPSVITSMYGPTPRYDGSFDYDEVSHHCPPDTLTKLQQYNATEYRIFFPKGILRNVLARLRLRSRYLKDFEYLEALDFEWGFPNDTGYVLRIQATTLRLEIPKNWWIHQQSPSLLGYHKHFFAPSYLQTIRTTYSYERRRRHYYNNGLYVKKPKTQYLAQRVDEVKQTLTSWPLPRHRINCKLNHRKYCSPRCGELEYYMLFAFHLISGNKNQTFIAPCINYLKHFTTLREQQIAYQDNNAFLTIRSQTPLYSYFLPNSPILSGPLITYHLHYDFLKTQLIEQTSIFNRNWYQLLTMFRRLKRLICTYIRSKDVYFFHFTNRQYQTRTFYTIDQNANLITKYYRSTTSLSQTIAQLYRTLDHPFTALTQQAKRVYALKFTVQSIEHLRNSPYLYSNTIYRHHYTYKSFSSTPILSVLYPTTTSSASTAPNPSPTIQSLLSFSKTSTTLAPAIIKPLITNFISQTQQSRDPTTQRTPSHILNTTLTYTSYASSDTTHHHYLTRPAAHSSRPLLIPSPIKLPSLPSAMINHLSQLESPQNLFSTLSGTFTFSSKNAFIVAYSVSHCPNSLLTTRASTSR